MTDLYVIQMDVTGDIKVGRSKHVETRLKELQTGAPHKLKVLLVAPGLGHLERSVHHALRAHRCRGQRGEWFSEEALGSLPVQIYNFIPVATLDDPDWWRQP